MRELTLKGGAALRRRLTKAKTTFAPMSELRKSSSISRKKSPSLPFKGTLNRVRFERCCGGRLSSGMQRYSTSFPSFDLIPTIRPHPYHSTRSRSNPNSTIQPGRSAFLQIFFFQVGNVFHQRRDFDGARRGEDEAHFGHGNSAPRRKNLQVGAGRWRRFGFATN